MVNKEKFKIFLEKLQSYFVSDDSEEWVDIEFIDSRRLDIRIVSDKAEDMDKTEAIIGEALTDLNKSADTGEKIVIGYKNYHTIDEAEFLNINKPLRRDVDQSSFTKIIKNRFEEIHEERINKSKVISFYSYKGGVGRTVALIQTAYLLAKSGKKVLLMDLDIEAPSFLNIFCDEIHKENGLVDYLYSKLYSTDRKVYLSDILSILNEDISGEIYLIPAGKLGMGYVEKLEQLKEKRIYENKYIQKLIREVEKDYKIDYTLIDSRTGINNWGALSLIDISDEVFLIAYPNKENIEGIKLIREIIKERRESTVVLSRVHSSNEANQISHEYFEELDLEQKLISILYDPGIAVAKKFPAKDLTKAYEEIYSIIIEREWNEEISKIIRKDEYTSEKILESLNQSIDDYFSGSGERFLSNNELKIINTSKIIMISKENQFKLFSEDVFIKSSKYATENDNELKVPFADNMIIKVDKWNGKFKMEYVLLAYLFKIINEDLINPNEEYKQSKKCELINKDLNQYINYVKESPDIYGEVRNVMTIKNLNDRGQFININLYYNKLINDLAAFLVTFDLETLIEEILTVKRSLNIGLRIQFDEEDYLKNKYIIDKYDINLLNLSWKIKSEENPQSVQGEIKEVIQNQVEYLIMEEIKKKIDKTSKRTFDNKPTKEIEEYLRNSFLFGKRVNPKLYSKEMVEWIYFELKNNNLLSKDNLMKVIKMAVEIEIENFENKKEFDRMISKSSLAKAIENLTN